MTLPDPRKYAPLNSNNPLISKVMALTNTHSGEQAPSKRQELQDQLSLLLASNDNAAILAALLQAPTQEAWLALMQCLYGIIDKKPEDCTQHATIFAIPVIIVAGSSKEASLSCRIDPDALLAIMHDTGLLARDSLTYIAPELVSIESLASITPSQLLEWKKGMCTPLQAGMKNLFRLPATPIKVKEESVWLRFLIGAVIQGNNAPPALKLDHRIETWAMPVAQALGEMLASDGASVLALPRTPQNWLAVQETARSILLETQLQMLASNSIRAIRAKQRTPVAVIASHENDEIRITISSKEDSERWYGFVWPLSTADHIELISQFAKELFHDCQVGDIRLVDAIQPDLHEDLPFFVTEHFPAKEHKP